MAERLLEDRPVNRPSDTAIVDPGAPEQAPPGEGPIDKAEALQSLLARMQGGSDFPAQSSAVREVSCMASSDHENLRRLSQAVMQDVALSQRLLRLANSSAYRPAGQDSVSTVSRALMVLGMDTVRTLALSLLLFDNVADVPRAGLIRDEFLRACPEFERMLIRSDITLIKYWFSVSDEEQEKRFKERINTPIKRWKFSPMDLQSRSRWVEYSRAKDDMFTYTDTEDCPWFVVDADDKRRARLNCISHLLGKVPYEAIHYEPITLPPIKAEGYERPPLTSQHFVPDVTVALESDKHGQ